MIKHRIIRLNKALKQIVQTDAPCVIMTREFNGQFTECSAWVKGCPALPCSPCNPCRRAIADTVQIIDDIDKL